MKCVLTVDDLWNLGFDHYFEPETKIPGVASAEGQMCLLNGFNDAKKYKEALHRKEDSNA